MAFSLKVHIQRAREAAFEDDQVGEAEFERQQKEQYKELKIPTW